MAQVVGNARPTFRETEPWVRLAARLGYLAKGLVYGAIGLLAFLAATGRGGRAADQKDAVNFLSTLPFGPAIVGVVGIGLLGYALWRMLEAIRNPEGKKPLKRVGYAISAVVYAGLGIAALSVALGQKATGDSRQAAAKVLNVPGGQAALIVAGLILAVAGLGSLVNAAQSSFMKTLRTEAMDAHERRVTETAGRVGIAARGVVFLLSGFFVTKAGWGGDAHEAGGTEEALRALAHAPYGPWLLGIVAFGLLAYAAYLALEAKYRRMVPID